MISNDGNVKVIDFGICKIQDMINSATLFKLGTSGYSAPEVHLHSENATEKSDIYSIGAVIYYLVTGKEPPLPAQFQEVLDKTYGIDIDLKPIIKKMVAENPEERYSNIYDLRVDFGKVFVRFLGIHKVAIFTADYEKIQKLRAQRLIPKGIGLKEVVNNNLPDNFADLYGFKKEDKENDIYTFLGFNYTMDCIFNCQLNVFQVIDFQKIVPYHADGLKKRYAKIVASVAFVDERIAHRQSINDSLEIRNIIEDYYNEYISKNNVDLEYRKHYGIWRELLVLVKENIQNNIVRLSYDYYKKDRDNIIFTLSKGVFLDEDKLDKEQAFAYEKSSRTSKDKIKPVTIGYYENDSYEKGHVVLTLKLRGTLKVKLPSRGAICLDYQKDLINVERQLEALDILEREDYSCTFNLKRILAGVEEPKNIILESDFVPFNKNLDFPQRTAVRKALNSDSITIIQGPPGTGKTKVIIEIIRQILRQNRLNPDLEKKKILLVSQSHPAVDKMLEDLIEVCGDNLSLVRIGRDNKLNKSIREKYGLVYVKDRWVQEVEKTCDKYSQCLLDELNITKESFDNYYIEMEKLKVENLNAEVNLELIHEFQKQTAGLKNERLRKILEIQKQWVDRISQCQEAELYNIKSTEIIAGTCTGFVSNKVIRDVDFDIVIIDEAAKATFPELAVSLNKAEKIIMVGDHMQLPPVLDTEIIRKNKDKINEKDLANGIFEYLYNNFPDSNRHRLTLQYRMHPRIGTLISHVFYGDEIQNGIDRTERVLSIKGYENIAIEWISTSMRGDGERREIVTGAKNKETYQNNLERNIIKEKLKELDESLEVKTSVAVITGYSAQRYLLSNMVKQQVYKNIEVDVDTVDAFQGSQKEIIIYSTVRSSENPYGIGFLKSEARLNVAFSRAKCLLIIVGDMDFLNNKNIRKNKFPEIINYIQQEDECRVINY